MSEKKEKHERFGRYLILDHLVDGGMAKICRARFLGEQADKIVAIKMVQPQFSQDESFKTMFLDELKVTFSLIHPNIVQTYDYGIYKNQLFVAMEYCDGRNLKEYLDKLKENKFVFPVEISIYIITQVCQALHYAHTLTDKLTGKKANIIHRDISPHNIMLTFDGAVKVIDFGIAKAETNSESTQAGTIKGKISYLAPEYLEGFDLDPRYDEFAVGITLWEMLCNRKLFKAKNELAILKKIQECNIPKPSSINPRVTKELDEIVLKCLSKDRNQRFENLDKLNRTLIKYLYSYFPDFNSSDLSYFSQELFKAEIKDDRSKMYEFGSIDLRPYLDDLKNEKDGVSSKEGIDEGPKLKKEQVLDFGFQQENTNKISLKKKRNNISILGEEENSESLKGGEEKKKKNLERTNKIHIPKKTTSKKKLRKKKKRGTSTKRKNHLRKKKNKKLILIFSLLIVSLIIIFTINRSNENPKITGNISKKNKDPIKTKPENESNKNIVDGQVTFKNFDSTQQKVFLNGKEVKVDVFGSFKIPLLKENIIRVEEIDLANFVTLVKLSKEKPQIELEIPKMPEVSYGYLVTYQDCLEGKIFFEIFKEKREETLPIDPQMGIAFPMDGELTPTKYKVKYKKKGEKILRNVEFTFKVEDDVVDLCNII
tara:strand:+ start:10273 stop:12234 length:1962 start_codon:yes stop_codon:yes gene_type:complete